jgi:hypothetical protein
MSPPPIAATRWKPSSSASTVITSNGINARGTSPVRDAPSAMNQTIRATEATMIARLSRCRPGSVIGVDVIRSLSLAQATIEPVKVTAPMNTPRNTSTEWIRAIASVAP